MQQHRKPLTARSVLASVLLGTDPPWLPTPLLVRTAELFGITEGTARTALSRMASAGEVAAGDGGYRLAGRLLGRQARLAAGRHPERRAWDGTWELAIVASDGRRAAGDRAALRDALGALRLAELREGAWARPANLDPARTPDARATAELWCGWWHGRPDDGVAPGELWDLDRWAAGARDLREEVAALAGPLEAGDTSVLADGFVTSAAVLRHLEADPLLPDELLPAGWPGDPLRADYERFDRAYRATLRQWFRSQR